MQFPSTLPFVIPLLVVLLCPQEAPTQRQAALHVVHEKKNIADMSPTVKCLYACINVGSSPLRKRRLHECNTYRQQSSPKSDL